MSKEYKKKSDVPDLYTILSLSKDVCDDPNCQDIIHKAYMRKARLCHPDKHPDKKEATEVFELLTAAYNVLRDEKQRTAYNNLLQLQKQTSNDFPKLKEMSKDYMQTMGEYKPANKEQLVSFAQQMKLMDQKHGYDSSDEIPISKKDAKKKMSELEQTRAVQDRELKPNKLFDDGRFDLSKFNAAFDLVHKDEDSIIPHNGTPAAWDLYGSAISFGQFDNMDNLYDDSNDQKYYSKVEFTVPRRTINKDDLINLEPAEYTKGHSSIEEDYYKNIKEKLRQRKTDNTEFESLSFDKFNQDTAGYGIFDKLGIDFMDESLVDDKISGLIKNLTKEQISALNL